MGGAERDVGLDRYGRVVPIGRDADSDPVTLRREVDLFEEGLSDSRQAELPIGSGYHHPRARRELVFLLDLEGQPPTRCHERLLMCKGIGDPQLLAQASDQAADVSHWYFVDPSVLAHVPAFHELAPSQVGRSGWCWSDDGLVDHSIARYAFEPITEGPFGNLKVFGCQRRAVERLIERRESRHLISVARAVVGAIPIGYCAWPRCRRFGARFAARYSANTRPESDG